MLCQLSMRAGISLLCCGLILGCGDFEFEKTRLPEAESRIVVIDGGTNSGAWGTDPPSTADGGALPKDAGVPVPDAGGSAPDSGPSKPQPQGLCGSVVESDVFNLVNQRRAEAGLPAYACDLAVAAVARAYSKRMCEENFFSHVAPDGQTPGIGSKQQGSAIAVLRRTSLPVRVPPPV